MAALEGPLLLPPSASLTTSPQTTCDQATWESQLEIFCCLATNSHLQAELTLEGLDKMMQPEPTFFACRAIRRLLLGERLHPFIHQEGTLLGKVGRRYSGEGLIIDGGGVFTRGQIDTDNYLPAVGSWELTDDCDKPCEFRELRSLYLPVLLTCTICYKAMFRIVCRYLEFWEFEQCFHAFLAVLPHSLQPTIYQNYFALLESLKHLSFSIMPPASPDAQLHFLKFNISSFMATWGWHGELVSLRRAIAHNVERLPTVLKNLSKQSKHQDVKVNGRDLVGFQLALNQLVSRLHVKIQRKDPGPKPYRVVVSTPDCTYYLVYPGTPAIYRLVMCMAVADCIGHSCSGLHPCANFLGTHETPRLLAATLSRIRYAPKDRRAAMKGNLQACFQRYAATDARTLGSSTVSDMLEPTKHVSLENFKITIFNTNMVINTKISCHVPNTLQKTILNIPRLTNNFVIRKYSVKEPSFTISVFFSDNMCQGTAININISGDMLHFLFAMGTLKCFLPIRHIFPVSIANWNSTLDLHGLENQYMVRMGRKNVFWTTNFPSVVSSKDGLNVSWFKAATATISKVYGQPLVEQIRHELAPILTDQHARIDGNKNRIFSLLEHRNRSQIQTLHKRFLECLVECCSFLRLDVACIRRAAARGLFDFSKKIISHTKSKHECAVLGYKKCNLIPKIYARNKKTRLDELGRNANFISFVATTGHRFAALKPQIVRHAIRKLGLHWRHRTAASNEQTPPADPRVRCVRPLV
ncbi:MAG: ORF24 [Human gammaherpesvirus 8]|uniref:ORF24 n=1 Tax=Human herpesvirus 8 TaxID=37296 RepID=A0A0N9SBP7_HHV8|nr:ORF24 [Human gammaherpesvirus 8]ALH44528.1 ORF24 [Human gammaherpesvirus 8]ALH44792.1 ORF24 [Human gammaherpesvirus 8]ALH44968.1 ORF24 [Human gammaherpesvirus 8]ALH45142.1 ORF24 [Human gammaherpesvirus 8]